MIMICKAGGSKKKFNLLDPKLYPFYILHHSFLSFVRILTTCSYSKKNWGSKMSRLFTKKYYHMTFGKWFFWTWLLSWTNEKIFSLKFRENDTFATKVERIIFFSFFFVSNCNFNWHFLIFSLVFTNVFPRK